MSSTYIKQKSAICKELGLKKLALLPFAVFLVFSLLILSRLVSVKVHKVQNSRIGHFTVYTALTYLSTSQTSHNLRSNLINIYASSSPRSCNIYLEKMWKRRVFFVSGDLGWLIVEIFKRIPNSNVCVETFGNDKTGLILKNPPSLCFIPQEIRDGTNFLRTIGLEDQDKFVCLHVRDKSYLEKSSYLGWSPGRDWSHHDYRNSEISTYVAAAEKLAQLGYTVFRMGAIVEKSLDSKHPRVIDYATNGMRTEFLDIFLGAHCAFCVSTGSGWDSIPQIFRRPSLYVNLLPIFSHDCIVRDLLIYPKTLIDIDSKKTLGLSEIIYRDLQTAHSSENYRANGVDIQDLTSNELVEAVTEMAARVEGNHIETNMQRQMQRDLKHVLSMHPLLQSTHRAFPIRAEFASCFLSRYPNFLDGLD